MDYKAVLLDLGFHETKGCSCGGVKNEKYKKANLTVYVRPAKQTFKVKRMNYFITEYKPLNELHTTLNAEMVGM